MNVNRRFNSIARRISRSWQWKRLWQIFWLNLLALAAVLAAYLYAQETAVTGAFAGWALPRALTLDESLRGMAALRSLVYTFTYEGERHAVALAGFVDLTCRFGGPLLAFEGGCWVLSFLGGSRRAEKTPGNENGKDMG